MSKLTWSSRERPIGRLLGLGLDPLLHAEDTHRILRLRGRGINPLLHAAAMPDRLLKSLPNPGNPNPGLRPRPNPGLSDISRCSPGACWSPRGRRRRPRASTSPRSSPQELKFLHVRRVWKTFSRNEKSSVFCFKSLQSASKIN